MNIRYSTLYRYNKKLERSSSDDSIYTEKLIPDYAVRKRKNFVEYITKCNIMLYSLTVLDTRKLA